MQLDQASPEVILEGDGIAAVCAARLLTDAGVRCAIDAQARPKVAAILLGEQTQHLFRELFPTQAGSDDLFSGFARVSRRIVLWGDAAAPVDLPHRGVVAPEGELLRRLWQRVPALPRATRHDVAFRVCSSRSSTPFSQDRAFGNRVGRIAAVELAAQAGKERCWVESTGPGWLFLLCLGGRIASLIAVGDSIGQLLDESRLIRSNVGAILSEGASVPVYPRLLQTLAGENWIACGSAAMSFDPLCGEGAGHAIREGFLAAAVIRSALLGTSTEALAQHYTARLKQGLLRHLQTCLPFYATGGMRSDAASSFWTGEATALQQGIATLQGELTQLPPPRFRLVDRDLVEI